MKTLRQLNIYSLFLTRGKLVTPQMNFANEINNIEMILSQSFHPWIDDYIKGKNLLAEAYSKKEKNKQKRQRVDKETEIIFKFWMIGLLLIFVGIFVLQELYQDKRVNNFTAGLFLMTYIFMIGPILSMYPLAQYSELDHQELCARLDTEKLQRHYFSISSRERKIVLEENRLKTEKLILERKDSPAIRR